MAQRTKPRISEVIAPDSDWSITWPGFDQLRERDLESLMTIGNGYLGTRGSVEEGSKASRPLTLIAGLFNALPEADNMPELAAAPNWLSLRVTVDGVGLSVEAGEILDHSRTLDLKTGILVRNWRHRDECGRITSYRSIRFASMADRHTLGMRIWITPENYSGRLRVESAIDGDVDNTGGPTGADHIRYLETTYSKPIESGGIAFAMRTKGRRPDAPRVSLAMAQRTLVFSQTRSGSPERVDGYTANLNARDHFPEQKNVEHQYSTNSLGAAEIIEWDISEGITYVINKFVSVWTSRDIGGKSAPRSRRSVGQAGVKKALSRPDGQVVMRTADAFEETTMEHALNHLVMQTSAGMDSLLSDSIAAWRDRWVDANIGIEKALDVQQALRFGMYHLIIASNPDDEHVSISARTLSGEVYNGHVFWDTEIFMLPFFIFTHPKSARALLMYRYWTLRGAREKARANGYKGAMYAWESADTGIETTPTQVVLPTGETAKVLSGIEEDHISADIPFAIWQYWRATGDEDFFLNFGAEVIFECARFWASRVTEGKDQTFHILRVVGPDEYHEDVNDDAFTNATASWTLETAAGVFDWMNHHHREALRTLKSRVALEDKEPGQWRDIGARMYTGLDRKTGLIEQCCGFFKLESIDLSSFEPRTAPIDMLLGHDRIQQVQVVKQADVLMLFQLFWDKYPLDVIRKNYEYYEPATGHGSSLSPATHALIAARLGMTEAAQRFFSISANIDLGNGMGNASGGIHAATCGGLWQAFVFGFAGIDTTQNELAIEPRLPKAWGKVTIAIVFRGRHMHIEVDPVHLRVRITMKFESEPLNVRIGTVLSTVRSGRPLQASVANGKWRLEPADQ